MTLLTSTESIPLVAVNVLPDLRWLAFSRPSWAGSCTQDQAVIPVHNPVVDRPRTFEPVLLTVGCQVRIQPGEPLPYCPNSEWLFC